jgi:polar amino acid transport system substrate-binding protein
MNISKSIRHFCFTFLLTLGFSTVPVSVFPQTVDDLVLMTENYPPYNFEKDGKLKGIAIDLMASILKRVDSRQTVEDIRLLPWARGYQLTLNQKNTSLFSTTRTTEREKLFKWVGPITTTTIGLIALKERGIKISSLDDLKNYKVGVVRSDIGERLLVNAGISLQELDQIGGLDVTSTSITKLTNGRIDMWSYETNVALWEIKAEGLNADDYEIVHVLKEGELFFAFHKDTPEELLQQLQSALDTMKADGTYQSVIDKYVQ